MTATALHPTGAAKWPNAVSAMLLLAAGILSSLLYAGMTVFVGTQLVGYDANAQTISELSAIGAPTRTLWLSLAVPYTLLVIAFGYGIIKAGQASSPLRRAGKAILVFGALGVLWPFVPMHLRETLAAGGGTATDVMHIGFGVVSVTLMIAAMLFASVAFGRGFRVYSIVSAVIVLAFGAWTGTMARAMQANQPTPWMGLVERISLAAFLLWVVVFAVTLMRAVISRYGGARPSGSDPG